MHSQVMVMVMTEVTKILTTMTMMEQVIMVSKEIPRFLIHIRQKTFYNHERIVSDLSHSPLWAKQDS